jgi:hypothetical protein
LSGAAKSPVRAVAMIARSLFMVVIVWITGLETGDPPILFMAAQKN